MAPAPCLYAHRGAAADLPENTIPSFRRALDVGAHALEMDVHLTGDGHVVVSHDATGERMAGVHRRIRDCSLSEVRSWDMGRGFARPAAIAGQTLRMPTLEEVLVEFPGVPINVDAKRRAVTGPLVALVRRFGAEGRVRIASFDGPTLHAVRALGYAGETGLCRSEILRLVLLPARVHRVFPLHGRAAQIPTRAGPLALDTAELIAKCHALGLLVHYWTINEPACAARLLGLGADGIMTDDPARLAPVFSSGHFVV